MKLWKVQKFFGDLVYDLRSRNLLPVAILLLVALVAVPILISRGSSGSSASSVAPTAATATSAPEAQKAVLSYTPVGIRDYKRRLDDASPKNPFDQPPSAAPDAAAASTLSSAPVASTTSGATSSGSASAGSTTSSPPVSTGGSGPTKPRVFFFHSVADVSFGVVTAPLQRHKSLKTYAFLPNQTAPVLVYLGSTLDEKKALFSVSKYTDQLTGQGTCAPGPTDCSLLALGPGETEDMVYAGDGQTYRVKVNSIQRKFIKPQG